MINWMRAVLCLGLLYAGSAVAENPPPPIPLGQGTLKVVGANQVIIITPLTAPPTRTRCSFDRTNLTDSTKSAHAEVIWDPAEAAPLSKKVILENGEWQVSFSAQSQQHPTDAYANLAWSVFSFDAAFATGTCTDTRYAFAYRRLSGKEEALPQGALDKDQIITTPTWERVPIIFRSSEMPEIKTLVEQFGQRGEVYTPITSGQRSLAREAQPLVNDALQAVADVAMLRVEAQALDVAKERINQQLCGGWVDKQLEQVLPKLPGFGPQPSLYPVFAQTCSAIQRLTLQDLENVGTVLRRAMLADLGQFSAGLLRHRYAACLEPTARLKPECAPFLDTGETTRDYALILAGMAAVLVSSQLELPALSDAQLLVHQILESLNEKIVTGFDASKMGKVLSESEAAKLGLIVTAGAIAWCHANGRCDTNAIRNITHDPSQFFKPFSGLTPEKIKELFKNDAYQRLQGQIISMVEQGLEAMAPRKGEDARVALRRAATFVFDTFDMLLQMDCGGGARTSRCTELHARAANLRSLTLGVLNQDPPTAVLALAAVLATELIHPDQAELARGLRAAGALSSYAASYDNPADRILTPQERRERRAQAVNALADLATERMVRVHEFSGSLGVTAGIRPLRSIGGANIQEGYGLQASFPMGVTGHYLCSENFGFFGALNFVDVGQYITTQRQDLGDPDGPTGEADPAPKFSPSPYTSLMVGGQLGLQYHGFVLAFDARYSPQLQTDVSNTSIGIQLGYYIPLLQLF